MLTIKYHKIFKQDYKRLQKRGYNLSLLNEVIELLIQQKPLPPHYKDHPLGGQFKGYRDLHLQPDWLLIYKIEETDLTLMLSRTGSHSDLF